MSDADLPPRPDADPDLVDRLRDRLLARVTGGGLVGPERPRVPGYTLDRKLGEGGMGEVWAARDDRGRRVALKIIKEAVASMPTVRRRFMREARALAALDHPGIVAIVDVGEAADGRPFLAMEFVEGVTLADHLTQYGALAWTDARAIIEQIAQALVAAHTRGVVHRDVKPSNVMLAMHDGRPRCRLIDFGLARHHREGPDASSHTRTGHLLGTPAYMSPEQLRGQHADARSDVYALGCVAYEILTGARPFGTGTVEELFYRHLLEPPAPPRGMRVPDDLRPAIEAWLLRALCKRPEHRYPDMQAFLSALHDAVQYGHVVEVPTELVVGATIASPPRRRGRVALPIVAAVALGGWWVGQRTGSDTATQAIEPPPIATPGATSTERAIALAAGIAFTCAVSERHAVQCWGSDSRGRLGRGTDGSNVGDNEFPSTVPSSSVPPDRPIAELAIDNASRHACLRFVDGGVRCWGHNVDGQLGLGTRAIWGDDGHETIALSADLPVPPAAAVSTGYRSTCIVDRQGLAYCWGRGDEGLRGDGTRTSIGDDEPLGPDSLRPVALGDRRVRRLDLGRDHACALLDDGSVRCWGDNAKGQLGVPDWRFRIGDGLGDGRGRGERPDDPTLAVAGLGDVEVVDIVAGTGRSCIVTATGTVRCWGDDANGVLGYAPASVPGCSDPDTCIVATAERDIALPHAHVVAITLGDEHACALSNDGAVHCWGSAIWGRLGDGRARLASAASIESTPVAIEPRRVDLGDTDGDGNIDPAVHVAAGDRYTCALMKTGGVRCWGYGEAGALGYASSDIVGDNETPADYYAAIGTADVPIF